MSLPQIKRKNFTEKRNSSLCLDEVLRKYNRNMTDDEESSQVFFTTAGSKLLGKHFGKENEVNFERNILKQISKMTGINSMALNESKMKKNAFRSLRKTCAKSMTAGNWRSSKAKDTHQTPKDHRDLLTHIDQSRQDQKFDRFDSIAPVYNLFNSRTEGNDVSEGKESSRFRRKNTKSVRSHKSFGFSNKSREEKNPKSLRKIISDKVAKKHKKGYDNYKGIFKVKLNMKTEKMIVTPTSGTGKAETVCFDEVLSKFLDSWEMFTGLEKNLKALGYYFKGILGLRGVRDKEDALDVGTSADFAIHEEEIDPIVLHRMMERQARKKLLKERILQMRLQRDQKLGILKDNAYVLRDEDQLSAQAKKNGRLVKNVTDKTHATICKLLLDIHGKPKRNLSLNYMRVQSLYRKKYHGSHILMEVERLRNTLLDRFYHSGLDPYNTASKSDWSKKYKKTQSMNQTTQSRFGITRSNLGTDESKAGMGEKVAMRREAAFITPKGQRKKMSLTRSKVNPLKTKIRRQDSSLNLLMFKKRASSKKSPRSKMSLSGRSNVFKKSNTFSRRSNISNNDIPERDKIIVTSKLFPSININLSLLNNKKQLLMDEFTATVVLKTLYFLKADLDKFIIRRKKEYYKSIKSSLKSNRDNVDKMILNVGFYDRQIKLKRINKDNRTKARLNLGNKSIVNAVALVDKAISSKGHNVMTRMNNFERYNGKLSQIQGKNIGCSNYINNILFGSGS